MEFLWLLSRLKICQKGLLKAFKWSNKSPLLRIRGNQRTFQAFVWSEYQCSDPCWLEAVYQSYEETLRWLTNLICLSTSEPVVKLQFDSSFSRPNLPHLTIPPIILLNSSFKTIRKHSNIFKNNNHTINTTVNKVIQCHMHSQFIKTT